MRNQIGPAFLSGFAAMGALAMAIPPDHNPAMAPLLGIIAVVTMLLAVQRGRNP